MRQTRYPSRDANGSVRKFQQEQHLGTFFFSYAFEGGRLRLDV